MEKMKNPHDKIYKRSLGQPEVMREFLELTLPGEIKEILDLGG